MAGKSGWLPIQARQFTKNVQEQLTLTREDEDDLELFERRKDTVLVPRSLWSGLGVRPVVSMGSQMKQLQEIGLRDEQPRAVAAMQSTLQETWGGVLEAACGKGKALAHGEPVMTDVGEVPVEEIREGDYVIGTDGSCYPVTGVFPQGERELWRVTFTDGTHVDCDGDHLWTLEKRRGTGKAVTLTTDALACENLRNSAGRRFYAPQPKPVKWKERQLPVDPYTLGALLGDGHLSTRTRVLFTTADEEILKYMRVGILHRFKILSQQNSGAATTYLIATKREDAGKVQPIRRALAGLGLMGTTSHTKFIPEPYKMSAPSQRLSILQGLLDTDGTPVGGGCAEHVTVSERVAEDVRFLVCSLGGTCTVGVAQKWCTKDGERIGPFRCFRLRVKLPSGAELFRLARKQEKLSTIRQREPYRAVDSVTRIGRGLATCISVDSPDRLFLTRNFTPTHNTVMGLELARRFERSTLVLVHKTFLQDQWVSRIKQFFPRARVGVWRQDRQDSGVDHDFVIGMVQSITSEGREYPSELYRSFGMLICDEVHRFSAPLWQTAIGKFPAKYRLGLTATPDRTDGLQGVYLAHIGPISYRMESQPTKPVVRRVNLHTNVEVPYLWNGELNTSGLITLLAEDEERSKEIAAYAVRAVKTGRRVLILTERLVQVAFMVLHIQDLLPSDCQVRQYIGGMKPEVLKLAETADVVVGTYQMAQEGLDLPDLDTLLLATPKTAVTQSIGRILREVPGKKDPVVVDFVDYRVDILQAYWGKRRRLYQSLGYLSQRQTAHG